MSGHVMLTGGRGLWTTATAAVGPQCLRYWQPAEVHKGATVYRIVPADSLPRPPPRVM